MKKLIFFLMIPLFLFGKNTNQKSLKPDSLKNILIGNVNVSEEAQYTKYRFFNLHQTNPKKKNRKKEKTTLDKRFFAASGELWIDSSMIYTYLEDILEEKKFIDTTTLIDSTAYNYWNSLLLNLTINEIILISDRSRFAGAISVKLDIDWEFLDYYEKTIYTVNTQTTSNDFVTTTLDRGDNRYEELKSNLERNRKSIEIDTERKWEKDYFMTTRPMVKKAPYSEEFTNEDRRLLSIKSAIKNAMKNGFVEFVQTEKADDLLEYKTKEEIFYEIALPPSKSYVSNLPQAIKSSVTIKMEQRHGSGFIISTDGYIITSYHALIDSMNLKVILNDESEYDAQIIRLNPVYDLALLKIDAQNLLPFQFSTSKKVEIAAEIYTISTPTAEDLSQSVSAGIISGLRKLYKDSRLIQTDASVNSGSSGGPIITKEGLVLGMVSSKLSGIGIEGVAFGIPSYEILNELNIVTKF